jgi:hypothetical protein
MATPTNLPAAFVAGAILTADQQNSLRGAFRVLQVIEGRSTTQVANGTTSYVDTGLTATITPQATTNKVLVIATTPIYMADSDCNVFLQVLRGGTSLAINQQNDSNSPNAQTTSSMVILDTPATISATTYKVQFKNNVSSRTSYAMNASQFGSIILVEISA